MNKENKQIDIVMKYFYPVTAGIEITVMETFSRLVKKGWIVRVHTSKDTYLERNILDDKEMKDGVEIIRYKWSLLGFWPRIDWQNTSVVVLENFNVFPHFQIMLFKFLGKLIKKDFKLVLTPHGGYTPEWRVFGKISGTFKRLYHKYIGVWLINHCVDRVHTVSTWEKEEMLPFGVKQEKVKVIENGLESEAYLDIEYQVSDEFKEQIESYGKYIVQIGRVHPIKNHKTTIKALVGLPKDVSYVITGPVHEKDYKEELDKLIKKLGLEERVIFSGIVKGADKYYLIKKSIAMVHMALWECYCGVVLEAMSQEKLSVVSEDSAFPYVKNGKFNGYNLKADDEMAVIKALKKIINNPASGEHKKYLENNLKYASEHSWDKIAERLDKFYSKFI